MRWKGGRHVFGHMCVSEVAAGRILESFLEQMFISAMTMMSFLDATTRRFHFQKILLADLATFREAQLVLSSRSMLLLLWCRSHFRRMGSLSPFHVLAAYHKALDSDSPCRHVSL